METEFDELVAEILQNARNDRKSLEDLRKKILDHAEKLGKEPDSEPLVLIGISENIAKVSDVLNRTNAQLVDLSKILVKRGADKKQNDRDDLFNAIEDSESQEDELN